MKHSVKEEVETIVFEKKLDLEIYSINSVTRKEKLEYTGKTNNIPMKFDTKIYHSISCGKKKIIANYIEYVGKPEPIGLYLKQIQEKNQSVLSQK